MSQPDRADRYLETEQDIPITTLPTNSRRGVRGQPTSAPRPTRTAASAGSDGEHLLDNGICTSCGY